MLTQTPPHPPPKKIKAQTLGHVNLNPTNMALSLTLQHRGFPVSIAKFLRTPILKNICEWLRLNFWKLFIKNLSGANFLHPYHSD